MTELGPARTMFASKAMEMHDLFAMRFKDTVVGSKVPRRILVQEMDVESTGGGKLARMSITLVPEGDASHKLVCGWIHISENKVRLRSHKTLSEIFKAQAKHFFDLPKEEYQVFVNEVRSFLDENNFILDVFDEQVKTPGAPAGMKTQIAAPQQLGKGMMLAVAAGAVLVLVGLLFFLIR